MKTQTEGPWSWAADSYGKVRHSRKFCVFAVERGEGGERLVTVAGRIERSTDARRIASVPSMIKLLERIATWDDEINLIRYYCADLLTAIDSDVTPAEVYAKVQQRTTRP